MAYGKRFGLLCEHLKAKEISTAPNFYRPGQLDYRKFKQAYEEEIKASVLFIAGASEAAIKFGSVEPMKRH
jgi:hypothetical protein